MNNNIPPAQLWIGDHPTLINSTIHYLKTVFCQSNACSRCVACTLITEQRHHATLWLAPEKQYTLAALEPITRTLPFALEHKQHFFFIIQKADFLPIACQNMLLKTVEEPPRGYHFIFLAEHKDSLLQTVQSRCHITIHRQDGSHNDRAATIIHLFTAAAEQSVLHSADEIDKKNLNEQESTEALNSIISYWMKRHIATNSAATHKKLHFFLRAQQQPPMPGSSKLFWKNLLLQWHHSFIE